MFGCCGIRNRIFSFFYTARSLGFSKIFNTTGQSCSTEYHLHFSGNHSVIPKLVRENYLYTTSLSAASYSIVQPAELAQCYFIVERTKVSFKPAAREFKHESPPGALTATPQRSAIWRCEDASASDARASIRGRRVKQKTPVSEVAARWMRTRVACLLAPTACGVCSPAVPLPRVRV